MRTLLALQRTLDLSDDCTMICTERRHFFCSRVCSGVSFDASSGRLTFSSLHLGCLALLQDTAAAVPYSSWTIRPTAGLGGSKAVITIHVRFCMAKTAALGFTLHVKADDLMLRRTNKLILQSLGWLAGWLTLYMHVMVDVDIDTNACVCTTTGAVSGQHQSRGQQ